MSTFSMQFTIDMPRDEVFARVREVLMPLGAIERRNGFELRAETHQEVTNPISMRVGIEAEGDNATFFSLDGSNLGMGPVPRQIGNERFAQIRSLIENACAK